MIHILSCTHPILQLNSYIAVFLTLWIRDACSFDKALMRDALVTFHYLSEGEAIISTVTTLNNAFS